MPRRGRRPQQGTLGEFIRERRDELQMTQRELGTRLGLSYGNFVGMVETGQSRFPLDRWLDWANALEEPPHRFLQRLFEEDETLKTMLPYVEIRPRGRN